MGTLRINGTIELSQFWPIGSSDADTTKIQLRIQKNAFEYRKEGNARFMQTKAFDDAISKGQGSKPVIKTSKKDSSRTITVRLQGIDAPELHYKAAPLRKLNTITDAMRTKYNAINRDERRQCFAESATIELAKFLSSIAGTKPQLACTFETEVDFPFEAIDTYGRFVGNIFLTDRTEINIWLIENGWALPAFYTSMSEEEIQRFLTGWKKGKKVNGRPSKAVSKDASIFDWDLVYRPPSDGISFVVGSDAGKVLIPKIFRRQVAWNVSKKANVISRSTTFAAFLKKSPDQLVLLNNFLSEGIHSAERRNLHEFVSAQNIIDGNPEDFVFQEKPGTLVDSTGKKVEKW